MLSPLPLLSSEDWFLMQFLYKQRMYFIWLKSSNLLSHINVCFSKMWTMNFQMFKLVLEKAEEPEFMLPTSAGLLIKQESSRKKTSVSALLTMGKPLTVWITTNSGKFWEMGIPDPLTCLLRNLYAGQEATVRNGHGTTDWFQLG